MSDHHKIRFDDIEWLRRMADVEDACESVSVGGLAIDLGIYRPAPAPAMDSIAREALAKLIEFTRRTLGLTAEQFAAHADVDLATMVRLEHAQAFSVDPQTLARLAPALGVPVARLMALAGFTTDADPDVQKAALRFAAKADPVHQLSPEERSSLGDFVRDLNRDPGAGYGRGGA